MNKNQEANMHFSDIVAEKDPGKREENIGILISLMTLNEKVHFMGGGCTLSELMHYGSAAYRAGGCERLGVPSLQFTDGPRGVMLNASTCFPVTIARGATWDAEFEERVGSVIGIEARSQGANLAGSVCINLLRHPAWGRAQETYGEDPHLLGVMGAALTRGIQKHIMACVKHFAANSIENSRFWVNVRMDERTLHEVYLPHFRKCVDAGAAVFMGAYNRLNGPHCCHSRRLLTDILREKWGFRGFVISDWTFGLRGPGAAAAGLDIEMPNAIFLGRLFKLLLKLRLVPVSMVDEAVRRIIRQFARFHDIGNPDDYQKATVACDEHVKLALEVARKSIVLLKNEGGILPLDANAVRRIAVVGKLADTINIGDMGSSKVRPSRVVTPLAGIRDRAGENVQIDYESGEDPQRAAKTASAADAVIMFAGLTCRDEGEYMPFITKGGDRKRLSLSREQEQFIKAVAAANRRCIVVLEGGSAIMMESWLDSVPVVLMAWYPGMQGGNAIADVLFGNVNPSGKLPLSIPRSEKQLVPFRRWARSIRYGYFHGYTYLQKGKQEPRFAFGYGLSFTEYSYRGLRIEPDVVGKEGSVKVTVEITNTGKMAGAEIAQLYIGCPKSKFERPEKLLKSFQKIAIEPGETKMVAFDVDARELAIYDSAIEDWLIESGEYSVFVGPSSRTEDLTLTGNFKIE